jgi:protein SCO1/2
MFSRSLFSRSLGIIPKGAMGMMVMTLMSASLLMTGCGADGPGELAGIVRDEPLRVGSVAVTDVTDTGEYATHDGLFEMVAPEGRLLVVYFGYTNCPDLCPTTLAFLRAAKRDLGQDGDLVDLAMVTVDPDRDTPKVLNGYLSSFTDRFHALHPADAAELETAENAFLASSSIVVGDDGKIEVGHSATAYVVDSAGDVLVEWPFGVDKDLMARDLRILLDRTKQEM